jgi:hypothetical protein
MEHSACLRSHPLKNIINCTHHILILAESSSAQSAQTLAVTAEIEGQYTIAGPVECRSEFQEVKISIHDKRPGALLAHQTVTIAKEGVQEDHNRRLCCAMLRLGSRNPPPLQGDAIFGWKGDTFKRETNLCRCTRNWLAWRIKQEICYPIAQDQPCRY